MKINPHDPAYPFEERYNGEDGELVRTHYGLPIRLELATRFVAGLISNGDLMVSAKKLDPKLDATVIAANFALELADALIAAYNEGD